MKPALLTSLKVLSICFLTSIIVFLGFGTKDIFAFIFWTLIFSVLLGVISIPLKLLLSNLNSYLQYIIYIILGIFIGLLWTLFVAYILGPWFASFRAPLFICWLTGSLSSMIFLAGNIGIKLEASHKLRYILVKIVIILIICFGIIFGSQPILTYLTHDRTLTLVAVKWYVFDSFNLTDPIGVLSPNQKSLIRDLGVKGNMKVDFTTTTGYGDSTGLIIILKSPVRKTVNLRLPDRGNVVYLQMRDTAFRYLPADVNFSDRTIELYTDSTESLTVNYKLKFTLGRTNSGTFLDWKYEH